MFFSIWFRRNKRRKIQYSGAGERALRCLFLVCLVGLACWGFWANSNSYVEKFKLEARIKDEAELLDKSKKKQLMSIIAEAEKKFGAKIYIKVSLVPIISSDTKPDSILFGVCPGFKQYAFLMPASWRQGLGESFLIRLGEDIMKPAFDVEQWPEALTLALQLLIQRLQQLSDGKAHAGHDLFPQP